MNVKLIGQVWSILITQLSVMYSYFICTISDYLYIQQDVKICDKAATSWIAHPNSGV